MAAKYPRFIITVDGQQAGLAWNHCEAWVQSLAMSRPGCVVRCEPTEVSAEVEAGEAGSLPPEPARTEEAN